MDMKVSRSTAQTASQFPNFDVAVENGIVPLVSGNDESVQAAALAAFIQVGTIPQLPGVGVPWAEFSTNIATFGDVDAAIRKAAAAANVSNFSPDYSIENEKLVVNMVAVQGARA